MLSVKNNPQRRPNFDVKKVKQRAVRLETTKNGTVILDKNNRKHREWYNG